MGRHHHGIGADLAWAALKGDPDLTGRITYAGPPGLLPARLPVMSLARSTVAVCALAAAELAAARDGGPVPAVRVDDGAVATAFVSERHLRVDGRAPSSFAPLSRFWRTADGWVRTHANYPHHRAQLLRGLGLPADCGAGEVAAELAGRRAEEIQETVYSAGGLAVAARTPEEWAAHKQGVAVSAHPLLMLDTVGAGAPPRTLPAVAGGPLLPAAGLRVLDLTRVIAGPVATRTLALLGADVLRIDAPRLPESQDAHSDTGFGKRSALLDLGSRSGRAAFDELLAARGRGGDRLPSARTGPLRAGPRGAGGTPPRPGRRPALGVGRGRALGRPARVRQPGAGGHRNRRRRGGTPTERPARCPPRPWTTARGICWPRRCCGH